MNSELAQRLEGYRGSYFRAWILAQTGLEKESVADIIRSYDNDKTIKPRRRLTYGYLRDCRTLARGVDVIASGKPGQVWNYDRNGATVKHSDGCESEYRYQEIYLR